MKTSQILLLRTDIVKKIVVTTIVKSAKSQLVRRGFEVVGEVYDNISQPRCWTLWGRGCLINDRVAEVVDIVGRDRFFRKSYTDIYKPSRR